MKYLVVISMLVVGLFAVDIVENNETNIFLDDIELTKKKESQDSMQDWLDGDFGLTPYKVNYLLPFGYRAGQYKEYIPTDEYKNMEAELQVSLKLKVGKNLFKLGEEYFLSYTHQAFWQIYSASSPFRETTYNPEAFVVFPISHGDSDFKFTSIKFALAHRSNGQGDNRNIEPMYQPFVPNRSRSLNYVYTEARFTYGTLITDIMLWYRLPEDPDTDDNPDLIDFTGHSSIKLSYFEQKHMFTFMGRINTKTGYGAMEGTYSYPILEDVFGYVKVFSGYGESLIDYNNYITKTSIGFSFSR